MRKALWRTGTAGAVLGVVLVTALSAADSAPANYQGSQFTASLSGNVGSPMGDSHGRGHASLTIVPGDNRLCYELSVSDIAPATGAQVLGMSDDEHDSHHNGGTSSPRSDHDSHTTVVANLKAPSTGSSSGCVDVAQKTLVDIVHDYDDYSVVILNKPFPHGALRGYLEHRR
jgi:hypothetical protein